MGKIRIEHGEVPYVAPDLCKVESSDWRRIKRCVSSITHKWEYARDFAFLCYGAVLSLFISMVTSAFTKIGLIVFCSLLLLGTISLVIHNKQTGTNAVHEEYLKDCIGDIENKWNDDF